MSDMPSEQENVAGGKKNGCSECSPPPAAKGGPAPPGLMWTRAGIILLLAFVAWITVFYCSQVYFDRDAAFHNALECSKQVLNDQNQKYWLRNGTLLGATRLGRLVLWDADLDLGVLVPSPHDFDMTSSLLDEKCFGHRSSVKYGFYNSSLRIWRKCTRRICAEFCETVVEGGIARTGEGSSDEARLLPLLPCKVSGLDCQCPNNAPYYLAQAYGQDWLTHPLTKLF